MASENHEDLRLQLASGLALNLFFAFSASFLGAGSERSFALFYDLSWIETLAAKLLDGLGIIASLDHSGRLLAFCVECDVLEICHWKIRVCM